ncbi:MAG: FtsH protease activity modulator HflK [Deltaproteobacteria bacterium]|jgi:membrane protease subunit HflK|nr:FtsH protease activity modulator HflK [Deltaproteobacteria bacterium]
MNWDWDKLQEKRKRQSVKQPPKENIPDAEDPEVSNDRQQERPQDHYDDPEGPINMEERRQRMRRENQYGRGGRGGFGGGRGGGNGPDLGQFGDAFNRMRKVRFPVFKLAIGVCLLGWLLSGVFIVEPGEVGVVLRFGEHVRTVDPGPHYRLPYPIEVSLTPNVHQVHRMEIGFSRVHSRDGREERRSIPDEAAMLTGDENIVYVHFIVQYQVRQAEDFLFNADMQVRNITADSMYSETVKNAAESAMREIIGHSKIDEAVYGNKGPIQDNSRELLQEILNRYSTGVFIQNVQLLDVLPPPEVDAAFKDLINAREDRSRFINEAGAYQNDIIPKARGVAAETLNQAQAYKVAVEQKAIGEAARFLAVVEEYNKAKDITKKRLYLDAMEAILASPDLEKIIIASGAANGVLPYLPLDRLPASGTGAASGLGQSGRASK